MSSKKKVIPLSEKYLVSDIEPGRYSVGERIFHTDQLDEETCEYLISINWPHIKRIDKKVK